VLLGKTADEVAPLKEAPDPKPYEALLERAAWGEWLLRVQSRTQCAPSALAQRQHCGRLNSHLCPPHLLSFSSVCGHCIAVCTPAGNAVRREQVASSIPRRIECRG
jgi:hypothetical protein